MRKVFKEFLNISIWYILMIPMAIFYALLFSERGLFPLTAAHFLYGIIGVGCIYGICMVWMINNVKLFK